MEIKPIPRPVGAAPTTAVSKLPSDRFQEALHDQRRYAQRRAAEHSGAVDPGIVLAQPVAPMAAEAALTMASSLSAALVAASDVASMSRAPVLQVQDVRMDSIQEGVRIAVLTPAVSGLSDGVDAVVQATGALDVSPTAAATAAVADSQGRDATRRAVVAEPPRDSPAAMPPVSGGTGPERPVETVSEPRAAAQASTPLLAPPQQMGGDGSAASQAQHTEAQSLQMQEHRAQQREAASLQASLGRTGSAASAFNYAFSSWGGEHLVRVQLGTTRTTVQGSSAQVEDGLRNAKALDGIDVIGLDAGSDRADANGHRRGRGRREPA